MEYICNDCPRRCNAVRGETGSGWCRMGAYPVLARAALHFDEEPVISGTRGSGAVFFSGCALGCRFCQNYDISHNGTGKTVTVSRLREIYAELIQQGAHNINLVSPTHFAHAVFESLEGGLPVPVVWNSGGYELVETIRRFDGRIDIYMPDLKYVSSALSKHWSMASDYFEHASRAIKEMLRQTGPVRLDEYGLMRSGVLIRHLILPGCAEDSMRVLDYISKELPGAWVSLMAQYLPFGEAVDIPGMDRQIAQEEYDLVFDHMMELGLNDGFVQELSSSDEKYIPSFDMTGV